ncbi:RagB/SusD family nutrient uptake outer membrane protein [Pinibacter aurantiacus]|uniref:RagB/SusD family nutrient uptake outer membrane protein n=1 Tax=Pinibacter aurantiacus TaxID=2851599 RepID=A0A9E2S9D8_9BACT|nr:RagB/SusD family nutrient uptake outer membrane protein [Pinibacter aurantiacus]MBV4357277.1 RagB/SusD family nutrient uptake outer membrane protein [Pinibacter aurantiacus]
MTNKSIKKYIRRSLTWGTSAYLICSLASCQKFLDRAPQDQVSTAVFWQTPQELDAYIINLYSWLPGDLTSGLGGYLVADNVSDNMVLSSGYNAFMNGENSTTPASGTGGAWATGFTAIRQINTFFDNYQRCTAPFAQIKQTYGEACFLKALRYEGLVAAYGDVPWYSHVISPNDSAQLYKARDPRSMVVDSIMALLDQSIMYLNTKAVNNNANRLNKESALIYKSRVALYEATWAKYHAGTPSASSVDANKMFQKAIDAFNQFKAEIPGGFTNKLYSTNNPQKDYYNLFGQFDYKAIPEVTLAKNYSQALGVTNQVGYMVWLYGYSGNAFSLDMVKSYLKNDGTYIDITDTVNVVTTKGAASLTQMANMLDPRMRQSMFIPGDLLNNNTAPYKDSIFRVPQMHLATASSNTITGFSPKKGHNPNSIMSNTTDPEIAGIAFRIPELMLNYVEAYVELNGTFPDLSDNIDLIRKRAGMPTLTSVKPVVNASWPSYGYTISDNLAIVRQERRVELAGEGFRTGDWKRWRAHALFSGSRPKGYKLVMADYAPYTTKPSVKLDAQGYVDPYQAMPNGKYNFNAGRDYLSPLPLDELIRNKSLVQNPGWDKPQ